MLVISGESKKCGANVAAVLTDVNKWFSLWKFRELTLYSGSNSGMATLSPIQKDSPNWLCQCQFLVLQRLNLDGLLSTGWLTKFGLTGHCLSAYLVFSLAPLHLILSFYANNLRLFLRQTNNSAHFKIYLCHFVKV